MVEKQSGGGDAGASRKSELHVRQTKSCHPHLPKPKSTAISCWSTARGRKRFSTTVTKRQSRQSVRRPLNVQASGIFWTIEVGFMTLRRGSDECRPGIANTHRKRRISPLTGDL